MGWFKRLIKTLDLYSSIQLYCVILAPLNEGERLSQKVEEIKI
jgi:hypothetical protein